MMQPTTSRFSGRICEISPNGDYARLEEVTLLFGDIHKVPSCVFVHIGALKEINSKTRFKMGTRYSFALRPSKRHQGKEEACELLEFRDVSLGNLNTAAGVHHFDEAPLGDGSPIEDSCALPVGETEAVRELTTPAPAYGHAPDFGDGVDPLSRDERRFIV